MASRKSLVVAGISFAAAGLSLASVGLLGYWLASPYLAIHELKRGAQQGDPDKIIKHVDFPAVRDDLKAQLITTITKKLQGDPQVAENPFAGVAAAFVLPMANLMIDTYVTPSGVKGLMGAASKQQDESPAANPIESAIRQQSLELSDRLSSSSMNYDGLNKFVLVSTTPEGKDIKLMFNRHGFADWKLVSIALPPP